MVDRGQIGARPEPATQDVDPIVRSKQSACHTLIVEHELLPLVNGVAIEDAIEKEWIVLNVVDSFGLAQSAIDGGRRSSASRAYLGPNRNRRNLTIRTHSLTTEVVLEAQTARGVRYLHRGRPEVVRADREVILCGGAFNSPQLLMLSGIGNAQELRRHDIRVVQHLPGVGENLQDHLSIPLEYRRIGEESPLHRMLRADRIGPALASAVFAGKGTATILPSGVNAILRSRPDVEPADLQMLFGAGALEARPWFPGFHEWKDLFYLRPIVSRPQSRGRLWLASADPRRSPRIDPRYLSERRDIEVLREGFRIAREVIHQRPLDPFRGEELNPGLTCRSLAEIDAHIRRTATTVQHACCTCRIGPDEDAVVDSNLRVRGVERLRVVDASVMPAILNCNIHAAVLAIAEWASDLIRGLPPLNSEPAPSRTDFTPPSTGTALSTAFSAGLLRRSR